MNEEATNSAKKINVREMNTADTKPLIYLYYYCCTYMLVRIAYTASWDGSNKHFRDGMVVVFPRAGSGR